MAVSMEKVQVAVAVRHKTFDGFLREGPDGTTVRADLGHDRLATEQYLEVPADHFIDGRAHRSARGAHDALFEATTAAMARGVVQHSLSATVLNAGSPGSAGVPTLFGCAEHPGLALGAAAEVFRQVAAARGTTAFTVGLSMVEVGATTICDLLHRAEGGASASFGGGSVCLCHSVGRVRELIQTAMSTLMARHRLDKGPCPNEFGNGHIVFTLAVERDDGIDRHDGREVATLRIVRCAPFVADAPLDLPKGFVSRGGAEGTLARPMSQLALVKACMAHLDLGVGGGAGPKKVFSALPRFVGDIFGGTSRTLVLVTVSTAQLERPGAVAALRLAGAAWHIVNRPDAAAVGLSGAAQAAGGIAIADLLTSVELDTMVQEHHVQTALLTTKRVALDDEKAKLRLRLEGKAADIAKLQKTLEMARDELEKRARQESEMKQQLTRLQAQYDHELLRQRKVEQAAQIQAQADRAAHRESLGDLKATAEAEIGKLSELALAKETEAKQSAAENATLASSLMLETARVDHLATTAEASIDKIRELEALVAATEKSKVAVENELAEVKEGLARALKAEESTRQDNNRLYAALTDEKQAHTQVQTDLTAALRQIALLNDQLIEAEQRHVAV